MKPFASKFHLFAFCAFLSLTLPTVAQPFQSGFYHLMDEGVTYYNEGKFEDALNSFRGALLLKPEDVTARHNLAITLAKLKEYEPAETEFSRLKKQLEEKEKQALQDYHRGVVHQEQAEAAIAESEAEGKEPKEVNESIKQATEQALESLAYFDQALKNRPDYPEAQQNRESVQRLLKKIAERPVPPPPPSGQQNNASDNDENEDQPDQSESQDNQQQNSDSGDNNQSDQQNQNNQQGSSDNQDSDSNQSEEKNSDQKGEMEGTPQQNESEQGEEQEGKEDQESENNAVAEQQESSEPKGGTEQKGTAEQSRGTAQSGDDEPTMTRAQAEALLQLLGNERMLTISPPKYNPDLRKGPDW